MPSVETIELPLMSRALPVLPETVDDEKREVDVIFTTGAQVRRYDWREREYYLEELVVSADAIDFGRLNNGAPVLDSHYSYSVDEVVAGVVPDSARVEGGKGVCRIRFPAAGVDTRADSAWGKIKAGVLRNISVGYRIVEFTEIRNGDATPVRRVGRWEPMEISLVPMGADDGAVVRSESGERRGNPESRREFSATFTRSGDSTMTKPNAAESAPNEPAQRNAPAETDEQRAAAMTAARQDGADAARAEISEILEIATIGKRGLAEVRGWLKDGKSPAEVRGIVADAAAAKSDETASRSAHAVNTEAGGADAMADAVRSIVTASGMKPKG